jgi:hypothetical protein
MRPATAGYMSEAQTRKVGGAMRLGNVGRLSAGLMAAAAIVAGSGQLPAAAATVKEPQYGFTFSLPAGWMQVPLNAGLVGQFLRDARKKVPAFAKTLDNEVAQATKAHLKFLAIGPVSGGFFPNINIGIEPSPSTASSPALLSLMKVEVKQLLAGLGVKQIQVSTPVLSFGAPVEATYAVRIHSGGLQLVHGLQLYLVHGGRLYVITFTAPTERADLESLHTVNTSWHWT